MTTTSLRSNVDSLGVKGGGGGALQIAEVSGEEAGRGLSPHRVGVYF